MSFISYAQNFEDVMLWRVLKHVENGFYIDVGANDPTVDSVSRAFYEHGWRGVHIEPTKQYAELLRKARPDEMVEQVALGDGVGSLTFYEFEDTGLSTADPEIAKRHQLDGFTAIETAVPIVSLDVILDRYGDREINWLKLDVEGLEKCVLDSWRTSGIRPWVLVIESTKPLTQVQSHHEWENLVFQKDYHFAYFDGLNRFYIHKEHADLIQFFNSPPNIFDGFALSGTASQPFYSLIEDRAQQAEVKAQQAEVKAQQAEVKAQQAEVKAQQAEVKAQQAEVKAQQAEEKAQQLENCAKRIEACTAKVNAELESTRQELQVVHQANHHHWQLSESRQQQIDALLRSRSWRITAPLRWVGRIARWFVQGSVAWLTFAPGCRPRRVARQTLISLKQYVTSRPHLKARAHRWLAPFPALKNRLKRVGAIPAQSTCFFTVQGPEQLSPRARQIYHDLQAAIEQHKKGQL